MKILNNSITKWCLLTGKNCFDVFYESNSKGFCDAERKVSVETKSDIVLGDSFTEGIAVPAEDYLTNLLEKDIDVTVECYASSQIMIKNSELCFKTPSVCESPVTKIRYSLAFLATIFAS